MTRTHHFKPPSKYPIKSMCTRAGVTALSDTPLMRQLAGILESYAAAMMNCFIPGIAPNVSIIENPHIPHDTIVASQFFKDSNNYILSDWQDKVGRYTDQHPDGPRKFHKGADGELYPYHPRHVLTQGKIIQGLSTATLVSFLVADIDPNAGNYVYDKLRNSEKKSIGYDFKRVDTGAAFHFPELDDYFPFASRMAITPDILTPKGLSNYVKNRWIYHEAEKLKLEGRKRDPENPTDRKFLKWHHREVLRKKELSNLETEYPELGFSKSAFSQTEINTTIQSLSNIPYQAMQQAAAPYEAALTKIRNKIAIELGIETATTLVGPENDILNRLYLRKIELTNLYYHQNPPDKDKPEQAPLQQVQHTEHKRRRITPEETDTYFRRQLVTTDPSTRDINRSI